MPNVAAKALATFLEQDAIITEAIKVRDEAFIRILQSGMTVYQISQATGLGDGSVRYWAKTLGHRPRRVNEEPAPSFKAAIARRAKPGSVLFK